MRIELYTDIYAGIKKEQVFFTSEPTPYKMEGARRFKVIVNLPDINEVDGVIEAYAPTEIEINDK